MKRLTKNQKKEIESESLSSKQVPVTKVSN